MSKRLSKLPKKKDQDKKAASAQYYRELMTGFTFKVKPKQAEPKKSKGSGRKGKNKEPDTIFHLERILDEVQVLSKEKSMSHKLAYNKYYWNIVCLSQVMKPFPEDKEGNPFAGMKKKEVVRSLQNSVKVYQNIVSGMESCFLADFAQRKIKEKGKKGQKKKEEETKHRNQFDNFLRMNYHYADWANQNKKSKELQEDKKWLKNLKGGMEEYFKQKVCEAHFKKVFSDPQYPIQKFLNALKAHLHKNFEDMAKGVFCNVTKLVEDMNDLPDRIVDRMVDGYKTQLKSVTREQFPVKVMKEFVKSALLLNNGRDIISLFQKFVNHKTIEKFDELRDVLFLDRMPLSDPRLLLPEDRIPYRTAINKLSTIQDTLEIKDQLIILDETFKEIFKCIDTYYEGRNKDNVGLRVKDTDLSLIVLYVVLNSDVYGISSWFHYIKAFNMQKRIRPSFKLFDFVIKWANEISIKKVTGEQLAAMKLEQTEDAKSPDATEEVSPAGNKESVSGVESPAVLTPVTPGTPLVVTKAPMYAKTAPTKSFSDSFGGEENKEQVMVSKTIFASEEERDAKLLELEKGLEDKNLLIKFLHKRILDKVNSVRKSLELPAIENKLIL